MQDWDPMILNKKLDSKNNSRSNNSSNTKPKLSDDAHKLYKIEAEDDVQPIKKVSHTLKTQIQSARCAKKISQKDLANKINVQETVIKDYELGKAVPDVKIVNKIGKALGVTLKMNS